MAIVNFDIPSTLEKRVKQVIQEKGFVSKAEFFRFAALYMIDLIEEKDSSEEARFIKLTKALRQEIIHRYGGKQLPSLRSQLAHV